MWSEGIFELTLLLSRLTALTLCASQSEVEVPGPFQDTIPNRAYEFRAQIPIADSPCDQLVS